MDLDLSALLLNQEGKVARRYDMVFYNQNSDQSGAVFHLGDDVLSEKRGQETLRLELDKVSEQLSELVVNLSCFQSEGDMRGLEMLEAVWLTVSRVKDGAVTDRFPYFLIFYTIYVYWAAGPQGVKLYFKMWLSL